MSGTNYIASNWRTPENSNSSKNDNYSLSFNGSSDFISCGNAPQIQLTGDISISAWFKTTSISTMIVAAKRDSPLGGNTYGWQLYCSGGAVVFLVTRPGPTTTSVTVATNISDGAWHHVLCTINQASNISIILDNEAEAVSSLPAGTFIDSGSDLRIGYNQIGSAHYYFNGEISEVALFDYLIPRASTLYGDATSGAGNPMALKPAAVGYWPLGDNSASDPLAQPNVAVEDASVFEFDGSGSSDEINTNATLSGLGFPATTVSEGSFSVSFWYNANTHVNYAPVVWSSTNYNLNDGFGISQQLGTTQLRFWVGRYSFNWVATSSLNTSQWYHIVAVFTGGSTYSLQTYVDGVPGSTSTGTTLYNITSSSNPLHLGSSGGAHVVSYPLDGKLSNTQIWNKGLSLSEVETLYNDGVPLLSGTQPQSSNLKAWYKLDQSANWEADTVGTWQIPDAVSEFPQSFNFDGVGDYVNCEANPLIGEGTLSISTWFNLATDVWHYILGDNSVQFRLKGSNGDTRISFYGSTDPFRAVVGTYVIGVWYNLTLTFDGSLAQADRLKLYLNGVPLSNWNVGTPSTTLLPNPSPANFMIGRGGSYSGSTINGKMSNVQLWDVTLSPEKVLTLYNGGTPTLTPPNQSNLKAWYKLDNNEIFDANNWSVENQKYPANWENCYNPSSAVGMLRDNDAKSAYSNQSFSISVWVKPKSAIATAGDIFSCKGSSNQGVALLYTNNALTLQMGDKNTTAINSQSGNWSYFNNVVVGASPTYTAYDQWSHIVTVWNGTNTKFYINGTLVQTTTPPSSLTIDYSQANTISAIGARNDAGSGYFTGMISNLAYWSSEIDQTSVTALYNNGTPEVSISQSPNHWFTLKDFATGSVDKVGSLNYENTLGVVEFANTFVSTEAATSIGLVEQSLVNNNVSALNGESSGMTSGNLVLSDLTRNLPYENYSLQFDGTEYINCGTGSSLKPTSAYSVSGWFKLDGLVATQKTIISNDNNNGYMTWVANDKLWFYHYDTNWRTITSNTTLVADTWYHFALTWDLSSTTGKMYINGVYDNQ